MEIIDINGKKRNVFDDSIKIIEHKVPMKGPYAKPGQMKKVKFVQVKIKPHFKTRTPWLEWYPLRDFVLKNPKVKI